MQFRTLPKLKPGDSVGIVSPSFVAPAVFPLEYELGLRRLREDFKLHPIELPHCKDPAATTQDKMSDLIRAFSKRFAVTIRLFLSFRAWISGTPLLSSACLTARR